MIKTVIMGTGRMGSLIRTTAEGVVDAAGQPVFDIVAQIGFDLSELEGAPAADVIIDFSNVVTFDAVVAYVERTGAALVSGTTGYTPDQMDRLRELGQSARIMHSGNYSIGIAALRHLVAQATRELPGFDCEIVETHHNQKVDAPSGTAKLLLDAVVEAEPEAGYHPVYGREGMCGARDPKEIGMHSLRGGTVAGVHEVSFFGQDEEVTLTHRATSRQIFVNGALAAAQKLVTREHGFYTFDQVMFAWPIINQSQLKERQQMSNAAEMDAQEIINYIATAPKKTPVKLYVREKPGMKVQWGNAHVYGGRRGKTVFGDWDELKAILDANADSIDYYDVENDCRNSAVPMLDLKGINARIEPGAIIRDRVEIGDRAVIMMGAIINIGSVIGEGSMIDMGAVLGGRATVGKNCHIGAGTVLAGVVEPASATPVIIEDDVMIGANAVVLEGVRVGKGAVVAAGAVCVEDVPAGAVVAGVPARVIKMRDEKTDSKTGLEEGLRQL